ncbi:hypothetical protein GIB67_001928 [Kingdonia uniflora]|uniref:Uncharacterized protein n=1 Tax=Kingdonia uniflora TaxID=39325 RepID=A0A7J7NVU4_9MAGN|nr:hypothetical protein GIB67_001928 [Kingdonia uniflora]
MGEEDMQVSRKRMKQVMEEKEGEDSEAIEEIAEGETEMNLVGSEEIELEINGVLEKIERFTQMVSELLESGKILFKDLSNDFEERMIGIHREHIEKWQDEIKELRLLDVSNEEANTLLSNARHLLQNVHIDP